MRELEIRVAPKVAYDDEVLKEYIKDKFNTEHFLLLKRSIDARKRRVEILLKIALYDADSPRTITYRLDNLPDVSKGEPVVIVGAGPAGLFAGLRCVELGFRPIVLERGQDVRERRRDLANINKKDIVNPESNYCFGEGGAGTYSDGKLYTRSKKRGDVTRVLEILVAHGAREDILIDAHPHIGTNKLPKIIQSIRESIIEHGGEVLFNKKVTDFVLEGEEIKAVKCGDDTFEGIGVVLATGHSARDIYKLLQKKKIHIEAKPFALGVRAEHSQSLIDTIQYSCEDRGPYLPASAYALRAQVPVNGQNQGVFSFCMCPGGFIVPSATEQNQVVVNGMSPSKRDSKYANSGIVVAVDESDYQDYADKGPLAGMYYQQAIEEQACLVAGGTQKAPAQRLTDFVQNKQSTSLLDTSYQPGLVAANLRDVLPEKVAYVLKEGFKVFGKKAKGYLTNDAQIVGVESRTSSPVKIPREKETFEHVQTKRLFPSAEGAGYAGGIVSAAIDGEKCAEKLIELYGKK